MAAAERGLVPQDLMTEPEVIELLPVFFRTLRGQKASPEEMRALVDKLKRR